MTDDELLALAVKARDCYGGGAPWERYFAAVTNPAAIIALIERRRAEVGKMWSASEEHRRDARHWEEKADTLSRNLAAEQRESSKLRAEIERLTRERDVYRVQASEEADRAIDAESALAAVTRERDEARTHWRCFHCGECFTDRALAAAHFGVQIDDVADEPACKLNEAEGGLAALLREAQAELRQYHEGDNRAEAAESALAALAAAPDDGADRVISDLLIASAPYADMDETGRLPKAREQAKRLLNEPDLSAKQRYANHYEEQIGFLVERFAEALSSKLRKAEGKYQYQGAWRRDSWHDALVQQIRRHMDKGDPLDVAAYCAFAWHHGWTLAAPHTSAESALAAAQKRVGVLEAALKECEEYFDNRADADGDSDGFHPNEEMRRLVEVRDALKAS